MGRAEIQNVGPCSPSKLLKATFEEGSQEDSRDMPHREEEELALCSHRCSIPVYGHMSPWGASIGPSAVGRPGME